jgi:hypothetical protein
LAEQNGRKQFMKETPRRRITVTSSVNETATDQLGIIGWGHGLIKYTDTTAKCRHKKNCKGALQQLFIRVYRLEIQSIMVVFSTQLCELLLL